MNINKNKIKNLKCTGNCHFFFYFRNKLPLDFKKIVFIPFVSGVPACMYVNHMQAWCPQRPEEGAEFLGTGVTWMVV